MKTRHVLTAITLAITLATGAVPVYATTNAWDQIGERKVRIEQLETEADALEARIKALSGEEAPVITTEEEADALAHDAALKKLQKDADSTRAAWKTASEAAEEASVKAEAAQDAVRDYQDACKTLEALLSAGMTLDDKLAADNARIAAINKEIKELETTPVSNAYDEQTLIKEAYDETRLVKEAYDEQELVSEAYDEEVKVQEAHTEEVEGDWTWTLPENASWADAIYKYGCICNTCNEIFYDDENETGQQKWSRHSDEMYVAWNNAGRPEKGTSPLWGHGGYHVAPRIVGYTVYYDDIYETVHHDPVYTTIHHDAEYTTIHHDAEYTTIHHDAVYDTEKINALKAERDALEAERETLLSHEDIVKKKEAAEQVLPMLLATAKQLADQEIVCKDKSDTATLTYQKALVGSVKVRTEQKLEELRETIDYEKNGTKFTDVMNPQAWYYDAVYWAARNGITSGYGEGTFQPNARLTRAQTVTFLYKMAGSPDVSGLSAPDFTDVQEGKWYCDAVKWAVANGITNGYGKGTFKPDVACSRAMIVTFLMRYARLTGVYTDPETTASFTDVKDTDWYVDAVNWAVANGITSGYGEGTFQPDVTCTRAMMVQFLKNFNDMANVA